MNPFLQTQYLTSLYEYIQKSDYSIVCRNFSKYSLDSLYLIHRDTVIDKRDSLFNARKVSSLQEFLDSSVKANPCVVNRNTTVKDTFIEDYFVQYFHENPSKQKDLLKFYRELSGVHLHSNYFDLFPKIFNDKKSLISSLHSLPAKAFNLQGSGEIEKFHNLLKSFKLTENEIKDTFFSYYNQRQSFLKDSSYSTNSKNFLLSLYESNNKGLEKYFSFMPFLKNEFFEINNEKDIFKKINCFEIVSEINLKAMLKTFSIDYYSVDKYESIIKIFSQAYALEMGSKNVDLYKIKNSKDSIRILISHNNPEFTQELFETKALKLLNFLKNNSSYPISDDSVKKWINHTNLSESLLEKKTSTLGIKI